MDEKFSDSLLDSKPWTLDGSEHIGTECVENIPVLSVSRVVFLAIYNKFLLMTDILLTLSIEMLEYMIIYRFTVYSDTMYSCQCE